MTIPHRDDGDPRSSESRYAAILVAAWWAALAGADPWDRMPIDDAFGEMRRVASTFARVLRDPADRAGHDWLLNAAENHGAFRRAQRCGLDILGFEFDVLAVVLERAIRREDVLPTLPAGSLSILAGEMHEVQLAAARGWATVRPKAITGRARRG